MARRKGGGKGERGDLRLFNPIQIQTFKKVQTQKLTLKIFSENADGNREPSDVQRGTKKSKQTHPGVWCGYFENRRNRQKRPTAYMGFGYKGRTTTDT